MPVDCLFSSAHQPHGVDDAGVIQLIGNENIVSSGNGGNQRFVCIPRADIGEGCTGAAEARDGLLNGSMAIERSADESHRCSARTKVPQALFSRGDYFRM